VLADLNRHFYKADVQRVAKELVKRCCMPLAIKETQIRATTGRLGRGLRGTALALHV
jgi:hypothetical protein